MKTKITLLLAPVLIVLLCSFLSPEKKSTKSDKRKIEKVEKVMKTYKTVLEKLNYDFEKFTELTPKEYKKLTGEKLSIKEAIVLKQIQKHLKESMNPMAGEDMPKWAYILLVILGLGFIPIGVMSDWTGNDWWLNILLTLCFWIPGVIHGLIVMKKYY